MNLHDYYFSTTVLITNIPALTQKHHESIKYKEQVSSPEMSDMQSCH